MSQRRTLVPIRESVLCRKLTSKDNVVADNGIFIKKDNVDIYEVLDFSLSDDEDKNIIELHKGDRVMSCSTGDEIEVNVGEIVYLFKQEHIMCKVLD